LFLYPTPINQNNMPQNLLNHVSQAHFAYNKQIF
jgi:hypothetical protein